MKRIYLFLMILHFFKCQANSNDINTQVCIYGNSSAAVIAAIQLKKCGRNVVIVSPDKYVGGMTIEGLGGSDINNHPDFKNDNVIGGITLDFYKEIANHYGVGILIQLEYTLILGDLSHM
jgi:hypothetical protein